MKSLFFSWKETWPSLPLELFVYRLSHIFRRGGEILKFLNTRCRVIYSEIVNGAALKTKSKALVRWLGKMLKMLWTTAPNLIREINSDFNGELWAISWQYRDFVVNNLPKNLKMKWKFSAESILLLEELILLVRNALFQEFGLIGFKFLFAE